MLQDDSAPEELGELSCMPKGEQNDMGVFCRRRGISRGEGFAVEVVWKGNFKGWGGSEHVSSRREGCASCMCAYSSSYLCRAPAAALGGGVWA